MKGMKGMMSSPKNSSACHKGEKAMDDDLRAVKDIIRRTSGTAPTNRGSSCSEAYDLQTDHWKATATRAKERASYRCQLCNSPDRLEVHHRTYERVGCELDADLVVLCDPCHERHHEVMADRKAYESSEAAKRFEHRLACDKALADFAKAAEGITSTRNDGTWSVSPLSGDRGYVGDRGGSYSGEIDVPFQAIQIGGPTAASYNDHVIALIPSSHPDAEANARFIQAARTLATTMLKDCQ